MTLDGQFLRTEDPKEENYKEIRWSSVVCWGPVSVLINTVLLYSRCQHAKLKDYSPVGMVAHACDFSTWEAATGAILSRDQVGLHNETVSPNSQGRKGREMKEERRGRKK